MSLQRGEKLTVGCGIGTSATKDHIVYSAQGYLIITETLSNNPFYAVSIHR